MAYFNHAFKKSFLATGPTQTAFPVTFPDGSTINATTSDGYVTTVAMPTYGLNQLSAISVGTYGTATTATTDGYIGWFDPKSNLTIDVGSSSASCCNAYLAGSAIYSNDKIGPLTGGYQETNKSKMVNPKYVSRFYSVDPCEPQNNVIHVGSTYWTAGGGVLIGSITTPGVGYLPAPQATAVATTTTTTLGSGTGLVLSITISALNVPSVSGIVNPGKGYAAGDTVTIDCIQALCVPGTLAIYTVSLLPGSVTEPHAQEGCGITPDCCKEYLCG